jgi:ABC-type glycerol-3-phosphate transport system substrate-binding protein
VPESGRYELAFRVNQQHYSNKATFRTIKLDGEVPHEGLLEYRFPYERGWYGLTLGSGKDTPYEFYLEKGTHTLTMEVTHGPVKPLIIELERLIDLVRAMDQDLQILTGGQVDKSRTWKESELPGLREQLAEALQMSEELRAGMLEINGKRDDVVTGLESAIRDFQKFLKYPAEVPNRLDELAVLMDKISSFHLMLVQQPLGLDQIYIVPVGAELPRTKASFLQSLDGAVQTFFHSFVRKDDISELDDNKLNVWVMRGRDYVNLLQELADELFTPVTGVEVKVNLITDENLLVLANAAGIQPDVALGLAQNRPFDYALRNAIVDLTEFADFEEVASHYAPGAILSYFYDGGYYALPETQSFNVLFYRKDILEQLGLEVPETWDDVYEMLPTLQQNHRNFHVNRTDFLPFIYQNGAEFFKADGTGILLDSPEAFAGFKQWTDLYSIYGVKQEVPSFYQHFRRGTLPIGIADYNMFVQLTASAPELYGRWGIAPIPGKAQPDGTIARWASGGQNAAVIYKKTEKKEAAWQFMKWWLSAEVQERYGGDLEAFNGPEFRWNTANVEAFVRLPWKADEARVILEQWKWFKEMPNLPGSYFVDREMNNGWNRTVVDHANYRTSLEKSITEIDREMLRKRQEFGFVDDNGDTLKTLDLPQVTTPWEGVDQFVPNGSVSPAN